MDRLGILAVAAVLTFSPAQAQQVDAIDSLVRDLLGPSGNARQEALDAMLERGELDVVSALIQTLRFLRRDAPAINRALQGLTGEEWTEWHDWMLWQEAHQEVTPYQGFDAFKADIMATIDPNFRLFLYPGVPHDIRLEEITWGGVAALDGIPSLDNPTMIAAADADIQSFGRRCFRATCVGIAPE